MDGNADREHEGLWSIAGEWATEGNVIGDPPMPVTGTDANDVTVGDQQVRAIEVIGERPSEGGDFLARSFDDQGNAEVMRVAIDDEGVFHFTGGPEIASVAQPAATTPARVRSTLTVAPDRGSMTALWERSEDGYSWEPWMNITFTRRR